MITEDPKALYKMLAALCQHVGVPGYSTARAPSAGAPASSGAIAPDDDLDSPYGDNEIRKDPPRWKGEPIAPRRMSECPADYLDQIASFNDWRAAKDEESNAVDAKGRPKAGYARKDAARARGWAARIRGGWKPTARTPDPAWVKPQPQYGTDPQAEAAYPGDWDEVMP